MVDEHMHMKVQVGSLSAQIVFPYEVKFRFEGDSNVPQFIIPMDKIQEVKSLD